MTFSPYAVVRKSVLRSVSRRHLRGLLGGKRDLVSTTVTRAVGLSSAVFLGRRRTGVHSPAPPSATAADQTRRTVIVPSVGAPFHTAGFEGVRAGGDPVQVFGPNVSVSRRPSGALRAKSHNGSLLENLALVLLGLPLLVDPGVALVGDLRDERQVGTTKAV